MRWVDENLQQSQAFLVVSGRTHWGSDPFSEWFPALTRQISLATPQGKEWLGDLSQAGRRHRALQMWAVRGLTCLEAWMAQAPEAEPNFILVAQYPEASGIQTVALLEGLQRSSDFDLVYSGSDAVVFAPRAGR